MSTGFVTSFSGMLFRAGVPVGVMEAVENEVLATRIDLLDSTLLGIVIRADCISIPLDAE